MNHGIRYRQQLKRCGFRGWKRANERRCDLIDKDVYRPDEMTDPERSELNALQRLADLYISWKTWRETAAQNRYLRRLYAKLKVIEGGSD